MSQPASTMHAARKRDARIIHASVRNRRSDACWRRYGFTDRSTPPETTEAALHACPRVIVYPGEESALAQEIDEHRLHEHRADGLRVRFETAPHFRGHF